ncbi:MAG: hypothetical protein HUU04_09945 [Verrucomicrobiae bacterium]|nr:hypothetical protein [Verrucomicrobiae bacterium]
MPSSIPPPPLIRPAPQEREILRELARRLRAHADLPEMERRRTLWEKQNALKNRRPLVLCFPEGSWREILPESVFVCRHPILRLWEWQLRTRLWTIERLRDDSFVLPWFDVDWRMTVGNYGFDIPMTYGDDRGSYVWHAPITDLEAELPKLNFRAIRVDHAATARDLEAAHELFRGILTPRIRTSCWWTLGMTWEASKLIGLENLMFAMCEHPARVHQIMAFLRDEHLHFIAMCENEGLLTPNDAADYVGSGGLGATRELRPYGAEHDVGIRLNERWGFAESQETVGISPKMFEEFVLPYQVPLLDKFGFNSYGCCEGLEHRIDAVLKNIPRLRRISVAPSADQEVLAQKLDGKYIFSRKPYPAHVCVGFNEAAIRDDLRRTLACAKGQPTEIILKDTHTVQGEPWRLERWVEIAREEIARAETPSVHP